MIDITNTRMYSCSVKSYLDCIDGVTFHENPYMVEKFQFFAQVLVLEKH